MWQLAQVLWLAVAYLLEFRGVAVFFELWVASVAFLGANAWFLVDVLRDVAWLESKGSELD